MTLVLVTTLLVAQGGLLSEAEPRPGLLVETPAAQAPKLSDMTLAQLDTERARVLAEAPSVLPGVLCITGGLAAFTVGVGIFLFATMVVGGIVMAISVPIVVVGFVLQFLTAPGRQAARDRVKEIDRAAAALRNPPRELLPPPPPPPGVWLTPGLVPLASF